MIYIVNYSALIIWFSLSYFFFKFLFKLKLFICFDFSSAYRTNCIMLQPFLETLSVEKVRLVMRKRSDITLTIFILLHANATFLHARSIKLMAEFTMNHSVYNWVGEEELMRLYNSLSSLERSHCHLVLYFLSYHALSNIY